MDCARRHPWRLLLPAVVMAVIAACTEDGGPPPAAAATVGGAEDEYEARIERARRARDPERLRQLLATLVLEEDVSDSRRARWLEEVDRLNAQHVWDPETIGPRFETTEVRSGESYWKIVRRIAASGGPRVSSGFLERLNRTPPRRLRAGQTLKVPRRPLSLLVDRQRFEISLLLDGGMIARWPIGVGRDGRTPTGEFVVDGKVKNPPWRDPQTGRNHPFGSPGHRIGTRWIGWARDGRRTGFGIHGTDEPESIGRQASLGCVRMREPDLEELFDLVAEGTSVVVR